MDDILKIVTETYPEYIPEELKELLDNLGFEKFCYLLDNYGGAHLYFPTKKRAFRLCVAMAIINEFDGANIRKLAKKYCISERTVRNYISRIS